MPPLRGSWCCANRFPRLDALGYVDCAAPRLSLFRLPASGSAFWFLLSAFCLPHLTGLRSAHHWRAVVATEGLGELRQVGHDAVDAVLAGRVGVGEGIHPQVLDALILAGPLREADKEALIGRESFDRLQARIGRGVLPCDVGEQGAAEVGDVLA